MTESKGYKKGMGMEGLIARFYDKNSRRYTMQLYREWAERLVQRIHEGAEVLEIAPGPGYLAIELAKLKKCRIGGLDISKTFVDIARRNAQEAGVEIDFRQGNASAMPFENDTFDLIVCTSSFKNFSDPVKSLQEMHRVLKSGGKAWISDLRRDVSDQAIRAFVANEMKVKGLAAVMMRYTFKHTLRPHAYLTEQFKEMTTKTQFKRAEIKNNPMDFEAFLEK
ncbi:MAG: hypothetical protein A2W19_09095 [Spirochaetes bacterium RBG_16_49_21]|nr:MAG: hypothetical protein A2W19_09095 [Spirochaetes bacterium RBG_16_49_21]